MKFNYFEGAQRTPEWFKIRLGKPTASRLKDWLATSKRDGKPLKARTDYEKEIMFERQFNTSFERFVSEAMQEGIDYEAFARFEYEEITGNTVVEVGAWYNEYFCASPDGDVILKGKNKPEGSLEVKWLKDSNWTEVLTTDKPLEDHSWQMQGQMLASKRKWTDYVAGNLNTKKLIIIRVKADKEMMARIEESLTEPLSISEFDMKHVHDFSQPALTEGVLTTPQLSGEEVVDDIKKLDF